MDCLVCKGSGKITIGMNTLTDKGWVPESDSEINCVHCDGKGIMTQEQKEIHDYEKNMWCTCGNKSEDYKFYDDGEHEEISKHHYRCADCEKVLQIG